MHCSRYKQTHTYQALFHDVVLSLLFLPLLALPWFGLAIFQHDLSGWRAYIECKPLIQQHQPCYCCTYRFPWIEVIWFCSKLAKIGTGVNKSCVYIIATPCCLLFVLLIINNLFITVLATFFFHFFFYYILLVCLQQCCQQLFFITYHCYYFADWHYVWF